MSGLFDAGAADPARRAKVQQLANTPAGGSGIMLGLSQFAKGSLAKSPNVAAAGTVKKKGRGKTGPRTILEAAHNKQTLG